jgi:RNA polymerase sigma factor (sigma-70 family)
MEPTLEDLVQHAKEGDKNALELLIQGIQDKVYGLALRMLGYPPDAEDAAQEILIKVVTHLDSFRQESQFTTWVYRVAANHLLTTRKRLAEKQAMTFDEYEAVLDTYLAAEWQESIPAAERDLIVHDVMLGCTHGLLLCLDRRQRLAYVLSEIFDLTSTQGAEILDISPAAYRKRLSRARERLQDFLLRICGLVNPDNPCHCRSVAPYAIQSKVVDPKNLLFAGHRSQAKGMDLSMEFLGELDSLQRVAALYRNHPDYAAPETFQESLKNLVDSGQFRIFDGLN